MSATQLTATLQPADCLTNSLVLQDPAGITHRKHFKSLGCYLPCEPDRLRWAFTATRAESKCYRQWVAATENRKLPALLTLNARERCCANPNIRVFFPLHLKRCMWRGLFGMPGCFFKTQIDRPQNIMGEVCFCSVQLFLETHYPPAYWYPHQGLQLYFQHLLNNHKIQNPLGSIHYDAFQRLHP